MNYEVIYFKIHKKYMIAQIMTLVMHISRFAEIPLYLLKYCPMFFFDGANQNEVNHYSYARPTLMFQSYTGKYLKGSTGMIDLNAVFIYM